MTQLAREARAYVIGTGRAADREKALDFGAQEFVDLDYDALEDVGGVDMVFDVIGGDSQKRSASLIRAGGTLVTVVGPREARPADGLAVDFVVESDRAQLRGIRARSKSRAQPDHVSVSALTTAIDADATSTDSASSPRRRVSAAAMPPTSTTAAGPGATSVKYTDVDMEQYGFKFASSQAPR